VKDSFSGGRESIGRMAAAVRRRIDHNTCMSFYRPASEVEGRRHTEEEGCNLFSPA
jgi:hypothetical protein